MKINKLLSFILLSISHFLCADHPIPSRALLDVAVLQPHASSHFKASLEKLGSFVRVSDDQRINLTLAAATVTAAAIAGVLVYRTNTCDQDNEVARSVTATLVPYRKYVSASHIILGNDRNLETKIEQVLDCCSLVVQSSTRNGVYEKLHQDLQSVQALHTWDIWLRTYFNPMIENEKQLIKSRIRNIKETLNFMKQNDAYLQLFELYKESEALIETVNPAYVSLKITDDLHEMKCNEPKQDQLFESVYMPEAFGGEDLPLYACAKTVLATKRKVAAFVGPQGSLKSSLENYEKLKEALASIQQALIVLHVALTHLPDYKLQVPESALEAQMQRDIQLRKAAEEHVQKFQKYAHEIAEKNQQVADAQLVEKKVQARAEKLRVRCPEQEARRQVEREEKVKKWISWALHHVLGSKA